MKLLLMRVSMAVLMLAGGFAATPVLAGHVLDFQVLGRGAVVSDCPLIVTEINCTVELAGQASGTHIGHDDFNLRLRVTGLGSRLGNGDIGGVCVVVHGSGTFVPPSAGTSITFNVTGIICEENGTSSPAHFNGTYRITGGTARFADAVGGGSLTATWRRGMNGLVFLHLHGTLDY